MRGKPGKVWTAQGRKVMVMLANADASVEVFEHVYMQLGACAVVRNRMISYPTHVLV